MGASIRILHLDDNPSDAQLVAITLELEQETFPTTLQYVQTQQEYLAALKQKNFDLILSDYRMPGYDGDQALAAAKVICPEIPFIMVTGELGEELVIETLKRGATDYVLKDRIFRLVPAIKRALQEAENQKKRVEAEATRERLVAELERRHGELLAIIQAMEGGVTVLDTYGNVVLVNEAEVKMLGYNDPSELMHNFSSFVDIYEFRDTAGKIVPVEDWPVSRVMRGETVTACELTGRRKDTGREWSFSFSGQPVREQSGKQILSVIVARDITERKHAEATLRKAERTTGEILESVRDPMYGLDRLWRFTYVNTKAEEFMDKSREELLGKTLWELFPQVLGTESERILRTAMESQTPVHYESESVLRGVWVGVHIFPKADGGLTVLYRDISERKANEKALRLSQELFAATFMGSPYPLSLSRVRDGMVLEVNEALLKLYGATREEVVGKTTFELGIWPDLRERERILEIIKRDGKIFESETTLKNRTREERRILVTVTLLTATEEPMVLSVLSDVTERKRTEESLKESEARFRTMADTTPVMIWVTDARGDIEMVNHAWEEFLGVRESEIKPPSSWRVLLHPEDEAAYAAAYVKAVQTKGSFNAEARVKHHSGEWRWIHSVGVPRFSPDGTFLGHVGSSPDITERKRAEESAREAHESYRALFEAIDEGFSILEVLFDPNSRPIDYRLLEVNPSFEQQTGLVNARGKRIRELAPNHDEHWFEIFGKVALTGQSIRFQNQATALNRWYDVFAFPWGRPEDRQVAVLFTDITARRQADERLKESEELSRLALNAGEAGAWSWDFRSDTVRWSDEFYRMFCIEPGSVAAGPEAAISRLHPEDRERVLSCIQQSRTTGDPIDLVHRVIWPDGSLHWIRGMAKAFFEDSSNRTPSRLVGLAVDVSAQIENEQRLQQLNQDLLKRNLELDAERLKWQRLIEGIADEVWACDLEGKVSVVNVGTKPSAGLMDFEGRSLDEVLAEIDVFYLDGSARPNEVSPLRRSLNGDVLRGEEIVRNRRTGVTRIRQYSSAPVGNAEGIIIGSVAVVRDVTEERQAEAQIRRLNEELEERVRQRTEALERANKELEAFSYSVSHDLKAPLRLINGFVDLLARQAGANLSEKQKEYLRTIQSQASHMEDLIKALLDFSRLSRKELRLVNVNTRQLVEQVVTEQRQILGGEAGERVTIQIADLPEVEADRILLRIVFTNLLSNAFKFTRTVSVPTITIEATRQDGFHRFCIRDNGVGFPKAQAERLFKVFQRLHGAEEFEGSGIGLANVRKIVEKHGGQVCGEGDEGKGAAFYFTLPVAAPSRTTMDF